MYVRPNAMKFVVHQSKREPEDRQYSSVQIKYCSCSLPSPLSGMTWCLIDDIPIGVGGRLAGGCQ